MRHLTARFLDPADLTVGTYSVLSHIGQCYEVCIVGYGEVKCILITVHIFFGNTSHTNNHYYCYDTVL